MHRLGDRDIGALVALVDTGRCGEAEVQALDLLGLHPEAGILWKILGVAQLRQGKDALAALQKTAELMPRDAEAHSNLGSALHERGRWVDALASLRRALALRPDDVGALAEAANCLKELGQVTDAITVYQQALRLDRRQPETLNNLGNALMQIGQHREAMAAYRHALDFMPDSAQIHFNLANAQRQSGLFEDAVGSSRRAIALDKGLAVAHNNLALALAGLGRREEAIASFREALVAAPANVDVLDNLGSALCDAGEFREAAGLFRQAIGLAPDRAETHGRLGAALFQFRPAHEVLPHFSRALALKPDLVAAHLGLAMALRAQRRHDEAAASCKAALAIDPDNAEALCLVGELCADQGDFPGAEKYFRQAIGINPVYAPAYFSVATHRRMTDGDVAWLHGAQRLLRKPQALGSEISLQYALGKYFDDVGRFDQAFTHYQQANELTRRCGFRYDAARLEARVDEIIDWFGASQVHGSAPAASSGPGLPVFVVGMPRSGTSLIEQILASHPNAYGAGELPFWDAAFTKVRSAGADSALPADRFALLQREYLERLTARAGAATRIVDKMPGNFLYAGLIHRVFPQARIIHVTRHPIDTCLSIYFQNYANVVAYANDLGDLAHFYRQYRRLTDHWRDVLPETSLLEVPYEGLIGDQQHWTRRMLDFIGLPWDAKCLDFHKTDRVVITASKWQVRQELYAASAGRWKNYEPFIGPLRPLLEAR